MAKAITFSAGKILLLVGDGEDPEVFTEPCATLGGTISFENELSETLVPDCADPDATGWMERDPISSSMSVSFKGLATAEGVTMMSTAVVNSERKNMRIQLVGGGTGGGTPDLRWSGAFRVSKFEMERERGEKLTFSAEFLSDGVITQASVAAL